MCIFVMMTISREEDRDVYHNYEIRTIQHPLTINQYA